MSELDAFLEEVLPRLVEADTALHDGDASLRIGMWSRNEPVTLFGASMTERGWGKIGPAFEALGERFASCSSFEHEVIAAGVSGDLAYTVAFERTTASLRGKPPAPYALRVTTVFRREEGEWKIVHRHGDPLVPGST